MPEIPDWTTKEELRDDLNAKDPAVALAIENAIKGLNNVQGFKMMIAVWLTQAQYDALQVKDANILYVVVA